MKDNDGKDSEIDYDSTIMKEGELPTAVKDKNAEINEI